MNRRQFNQAMLTVGALVTLPVCAGQTDAVAMTKLKSTNSRMNIGLVSVGGADGITVGEIAQGLPYLTRTVAIDTDVSALISSGADRTVLIGNGAHRPQHPRQAYEMARRRVEKIEAAISDLDLIIVIAGTYGAAGKGLTPVLAEIAQRKDISMVCIAMVHDEWQGENANSRVRQTIKRLQRSGATVFPIHSNRLSNPRDESAESVGQTLEHLCTFIGHALDPAQTTCLDIDSLRIALEPGGTGAMGFGSASGTGRIESALKEAINHPLLGMDRLRNASGVLINARGPSELKISEFFAAVRPIRTHLKIDPWMFYSVSVDKSIGETIAVSILATIPDTSA